MRQRILMCALAILLAAAGPLAGDEVRQPSAVDDARFDFLKRLAGTWVGDSDHVEIAQGVFEFRVTSGGTAIEEREMVGTPMEMLTVYHMRGEELVATHYCILGNQPHVTAARTVRDDTLAFTCDGAPGNARSHDEKHVHGWSMRLGPNGKLHYSAQLVEQGEVAEAPTLVLTRQEQTVRR